MFKFLILLLFEKMSSKDLFCKVDFLNAYGIEGEKNARFQKMLFCPDVKFNCCTPFDELKFHKNWHNFHKPKVIETY